MPIDNYLMTGKRRKGNHSTSQDNRTANSKWVSRPQIHDTRDETESIGGGWQRSWRHDSGDIEYVVQSETRKTSGSITSIDRSENTRAPGGRATKSLELLERAGGQKDTGKITTRKMAQSVAPLHGDPSH